MKIEKGFSSIKLVTNPKNSQALAFYAKLGYKKEALLKDHYGPGEDRFLLVKQLP